MGASSQRLTDELFPRLVDSPELLLQKLDIAQGRSLLIVMTPAEYRRAAFLDDRLIDEHSRGFWMETGALFRRLEERRPEYPSPQFIFHIGHCGSTLLSRLLAELGGFLPLREPPALRTLAELHRERDSVFAAVAPEEWSALFELVLYLSSRVFAGDRAAQVKATSDCNNLIGPVLAARPGTRGLLLFVRLETYLATMLRTPASRADIDGFAKTRLGDLHREIGEERLRLYELDTVRRAVVGWLANMAQMEAASREAAARTLRIDFDEFLAEPAAQLQTIASALGIEAGTADVERTLTSGVMSAYSKAPQHRYDAVSRARDLDRTRSAHGREIEQALRWAEEIVSGTPALSALRPYLR